MSIFVANPSSWLGILAFLKCFRSAWAFVRSMKLTLGTWLVGVEPRRIEDYRRVMSVDGKVMVELDQSPLPCLRY